MATPPDRPPSGPTDPPRDDDAGFSASDQVWLDRLAGRRTGPATEPAEREADVLLQALDARAEAAFNDSLSEGAAERHWQRLQQRIAAAGLALGSATGEVGLPTPQIDPVTAPGRPAPSRAPGPGFWSGWRGVLLGGSGSAAGSGQWRGVAALAGVAVLAVALVPLLRQERDIGGPPLEPGPLFKGGESEERVQRIATATPRRDAEAFAGALRAAGLTPGVYRDPDAAAGRVVLVDLYLEAEQIDAAGPIFDSRKLKRPGVGLARVVFAKP